ncbi:MAG TPA: hypothetical protein PKM50_01870, partial [Methanoregula sp.]|nr:hypothetical protein [Methanoregula sp.]
RGGERPGSHRNKTKKFLSGFLQSPIFDFVTVPVGNYQRDISRTGVEKNGGSSVCFMHGRIHFPALGIIIPKSVSIRRYFKRMTASLNSDKLLLKNV